MRAINRQIDVYLKNPDRITFKTKELINTITNKVKSDTSGECLDIGCGIGGLIRNLSHKLKKYNYTGFDISEDLIKAANKLNKNEKINFFVGDVNSIDFDKKFNIICASGVLSIFQEFEVPLEKWLSWLSDDGLLFIAGRFNSKNVDTKILFRNNSKKKADWEGGLTSYSINTVSTFIRKLGFNCNFKKFIPPIRIKEDMNNPIRTFTRDLKNGEKIVLDGGNIVAEHFLVTIGKNIET